MEIESRLNLLGDAASFDVCQSGGAVRRGDVARELERWVSPAVQSGGRVVRLLKVLLTNVCEANCRYCACRRDRDTPRGAFRPDDLARVFVELHRRGVVDGLFLSSGLAFSPGRTMERMLDTVELVRRRHQFGGYVHLKVLPGSERAAVEQAVRLADRVSINLEAPGPARLERLSGEKRYAELETRLRWIAAARRELRGAPGGITTQFVVGPAGESDGELLGTVARLYREIGLARTYFSAFHPISQTPLAELPPTPPRREARLYQADFLLRGYGFSPGELIFDGAGNLPLEADPKLAWAQAHPERFPVELNTADRAGLLRVPGVGPRGAARILAARRERRLREPAQLAALGVSPRRAGAFVLLDGRLAAPGRQLSLW